jgi:hypothetical protein
MTIVFAVQISLVINRFPSSLDVQRFSFKPILVRTHSPGFLIAHFMTLLWRQERATKAEEHN